MSLIAKDEYARDFAEEMAGIDEVLAANPTRRVAGVLRSALNWRSSELKSVCDVDGTRLTGEEIMEYLLLIMKRSSKASEIIHAE